MVAGWGGGDHGKLGDSAQNLNLPTVSSVKVLAKEKVVASKAYLSRGGRLHASNRSNEVYNVADDEEK